MRDRATVAEIASLSALFGYVIWVPLPFGSASDAAYTPFVLPPLLLCAIAAMTTLRHDAMRATRHGRLWLTGAVLFLAVVALQLLPMPMALLRLVSPQSARMWITADRVAMLGGVPHHALHPISIDPSMTLAEIFRIAAIVATFATAMFLVRTKERRQILAVVLSVAAMFEAGYAVRQAALGQYDIWGWKNKLIFNRATGTFVNPNHFAHYAAIIMPLAVFLCAVAWHTAAPPSAPRGHRIAMLLERRFVPFAFGLLATLACVAAILVSQSRGAMLASVAGFAVVGGLASGRRHAAARATLIALGVLTIFAAMFFVMGTAGESKHLEETDSTTFIGRRTAIESAFRIWLDFPLFGSGAGTFERLAPRFQKPGEMTLANHAHDDYAETLATTGAVGFLLAFVPLLAGAVALARGAFGAQAIRHATWRQRAYCAAALTSIVIALLHALVDFNFFISANPATLAAIAGAAAGVRRPEAT